jgi:[ribosomal protein S5]-alanine N-acetyltransferase
MRTGRLELIPAGIELCDAETLGKAALEICLAARVPASWPPPVFESDDVTRIRRQLEGDPASAAWTLHYLVASVPDGGGERHLVGVAGFVAPPTADGRVEIGYAIAAEHQRRGYASEAVTALVSAAFRDLRVVTVSATTFPTLAASIGVLAKSGFLQDGGVQADGTIRFVRRRGLEQAGD